MNKKIIIPILVLLVAVGTAIGIFATNKSESVSTAVSMPYCNGQKISNVTKTSFRFDFTIKNPSRVSVPNCGAEIQLNNSTVKTHTETIPSKHRTLASCPVWYEIGKGKEINYTLQAGKAYRVRGFCKYGGKTYYTGWASVTIPGGVTNPSVTNCRATGVGSNGFKLEFTINNPSRVSIPECGAQIRKQNKDGSWTGWSTKSESIVSNHRTLASIPAWYQVGSGKEFNYAISANTTYQIKGYCKYNGNTYWSNPATVTTPGVNNKADQAIAWVRSQEGKKLDYDGVPKEQPYQCVDLIKYYYKYLGVSPVKGNGVDYISNALPSGWTRIQGAQPRKGDILVYKGGSANQWGHVAIYESDYVTWHQAVIENGKLHAYVKKRTVHYTLPGESAYTNYWGVIRPNF